MESLDAQIRVLEAKKIELRINCKHDMQFSHMKTANGMMWDAYWICTKCDKYIVDHVADEQLASQGYRKEKG